MRITTDNLFEAIARFEGMRRVFLHQCVLTDAEIAGITSLSHYHDTLMRISLRDERGVGSSPYHDPVLPVCSTHWSIEYTTGTGRTHITLRSSGFDNDGDIRPYHVELWRLSNAPLTTSQRDNDLRWLMSDDFTWTITDGYKWPSHRRHATSTSPDYQGVAADPISAAVQVCREAVLTMRAATDWGCGDPEQDLAIAEIFANKLEERGYILATMITRLATMDPDKEPGLPNLD